MNPCSQRLCKANRGDRGCPSPGAGYSIYAIGGNDGTNPVADVQAYDTTTRTWSTVPSMPTSRLNLAAASLPGQVYAIGGSDGTGPLANHEVFNPAGGNWTTLAPLPTARESLGAASGPNGLIYAIGGQNESSALSTVEVFDVAFGTWSTATSLPSACRSLAAAVGPDGLIYAYGGLNFAQPTLNTMEAFTTGTPLTSPDPYIGNGTYQTADIVLLDAGNNPVPIGGAPGGA